MPEPISAPDQGGGSPEVYSKLPVILWERRWLIIIPTVLFALAGIAASILTPPSYQSRAILLVESQNLPGAENEKPEENGIDRRMAKIREQILSRTDLVELIQAHNLYNAASDRSQSLSALVEKMRKSTAISAVDADIEQGGKSKRDAESIAFSLTFDYPKPDLAQLITQTFVDRLLKLDASTSQAEALGNVRFLEDQETTLRDQLTAIETQINKVTGQNGVVLSAPGMGANPGSGNYEGQIAALQRENAALRAQTNATAIERDPGVVAAQAQLAAVRAQYSDDHPDVKLAENRLGAARAAAQNYQTKGVSSTVAAQIAANDAMIVTLNRARGVEQQRQVTMAAAQARGPAVVQQVAQLQAQADVVRANLGRITSSLLNARSTAKLTEEQRGERLTLMDPPVRADSPTSPKPLLLIGGGIAMGGALGLALAFLVELLLHPIRSVSALTRVMGEPPLAVVPVLSKRKFRPKNRFWSRKRKASGYN